MERKKAKVVSAAQSGRMAQLLLAAVFVVACANSVGKVMERNWTRKEKKKPHKAFLYLCKYCMCAVVVNSKFF